MELHSSLTSVLTPRKVFTHLCSQSEQFLEQDFLFVWVYLRYKRRIGRQDPWWRWIPSLRRTFCLRLGQFITVEWVSLAFNFAYLHSKLSIFVAHGCTARAMRISFEWRRGRYGYPNDWSSSLDSAGTYSARLIWFLYQYAPISWSHWSRAAVDQRDQRFFRLPSRLAPALTLARPVSSSLA